MKQVKFRSMLIYLFNDKWEVLLWEHQRWIWKWKRNWVWGKLNEWDDFISAAVRELNEETGIVLTKQDLKFMWKIIFTFDDENEWNWENYVYVWKSNQEQLIYDENEFIPKWVDIKDIPYDKMWEDDQYWLPRVLNWEEIEYVFNFGLDKKIRDFQKIK